jgi:hypothetical protein
MQKTAVCHRFTPVIIVVKTLQINALLENAEGSDQRVFDVIVYLD